MQNQVFRFKQFSIHEHPLVMKVGTDSILLGSWVSHFTHGNILDIGAGNGILSLMLAQKNPKAQIEAIEIAREAANICSFNFQHNLWADRMMIHHMALQNFKPPYSFDLIVCNPPYFNTGIIAPNKNRAIARHTETLSFKTLLQCVSLLLDSQGSFYLVIPFQSKKLFLELASNFLLYPQKICDVTSYTDKLPHISMLCLGKHISEKPTKYQKLIIYQDRDGKYSDEFKRLTKEFYL